MTENENNRLFLSWFPVVFLPSSNLILASLSGCVVKGYIAWAIGAIAEEVFFRCFILRSLLLPHMKPTRAIHLCSILFAGMHFYNLYTGEGFLAVFIQVFCAYAFSVWAGAVVCKTGKLIIPLLAHVFLNITATENIMWAETIVGVVVLLDGILLNRNTDNGKENRRHSDDK